MCILNILPASRTKKKNYFTTHLPVDAVLKADGVGRSAEDGQLQNESCRKRRHLVTDVCIQNHQRH